MKLISCYIERFGGLSEYEKQFASDFDTFFWENGMGKTTLTAFILAMLYGMDSIRANDKELKDRSRYLPWGGGRYGGSMTVESKGKRYRIERTFDSKSETKDSLAVYDLQSGERIALEGPVGDTLIGMPKASFLATACFTGKDQGTILGIMPRISSYVEGVNDTDLYENAIGSLQKASKNYSKKNGILDKCKADIKKCTEERNRCRSASDLAKEYEKRLSDLETEREPIKKRFDFLSRHAALIEQKKVLLSYKDKYDDAKSKLDRFILEKGSSFLEESQIEDLERRATQINEEKKRAMRTTDDDDLEKTIEEDRRLFANVSEEKLEEILTDIDELRGIKGDLKRMEGSNENAEYEYLREKFKSDLPSAQEISMLRSMENGLKAKKIAEEQLSRERAKRSSFSKKIGTGMLLTGLLLLLSAIVLLFVKAVAGAIVGVLALVILVFAVILLLHAKSIDTQDTAPDYLKEAELIDERLSALGYPVNDRSLSISRLADDRNRYIDLEKRQESAKEESVKLLEKQRSLIQRLNAFFAPFSLHFSEYPQMFNAVKKQYEQWILSEKEVQRRQFERTSAMQKVQRLQNELRASLLPYLKNEPSDMDLLQLLSTVKQRSKEYELLTKECLSRKNDLDQYQRSVNLDVLSQAEMPAEGEREKLEEKLDELEKEAAGVRLSLENTLSVADQLTETQGELSALEDRLEQEKDRSRILELTAGLLKDTHDELVNKYTKPVRSAYESYAMQIDPALCAGLRVIPSDMSLQFERNGALRKSDNFNSAFVILSNICMRLAILKVAYPEEHPFLVLDDPFVYLDDDNCQKALEALSKLASETQILYFTCHSGRTL